MRIALKSLLLVGLVVSLFALTRAQEPGLTPAQQKRAEERKAKITPMVMLKPGETKQLLLSTWCTVDITRGGGFILFEMGQERPGYGQRKTYTRAGVAITVPDFDEATQFAKSKEFAALNAQGISPFLVTVTTAADAQPGLFEMHLADETCSGHCQTDFRVLVVEK